MMPRLPASLAFQRADHRAEFDRARLAVRSTLKNISIDEAVKDLCDLGAALGGGVARLKRELLASALCWNEENRSLIDWIHQQHRRLADAARTLLADTATLPPQLAALALHHEAEAMKWMAGRDRPDLAALNVLAARAYELGIARHSIAWAFDGRGCQTTLEALYLRVLLIDRLGTGVLTRQQVEVLDAWLFDWRNDLRLFDARREGPALHVDLATARGLRAEAPADEARVLWLALAPLERRRQAVVREMQHGRIVPAYGCASEFRIEEHVTVLAHLQRAFIAPTEAAARRTAREAAPGTRVEAWAGLHEILARAGGPATAEGIDPSRRYFWLCDTSAGGCGFEAFEQDAAGLEIGDLVGWRNGGAVSLGRIIRRLPSKTQGQVFLGVRILSENTMPFTLERADIESPSAETHLYVPGDDASGRRDAFLVPESGFSAERAYRACVGDERWTLRFNRVRERGRGWILAGFEIVVPQSAPAPAPITAASFVLALEPVEPAEDVDPWSREVPLRLV